MKLVKQKVVIALIALVYLINDPFLRGFRTVISYGNEKKGEVRYHLPLFFVKVS